MKKINEVKEVQEVKKEIQGKKEERKMKAKTTKKTNNRKEENKMNKTTKTNVLNKGTTEVIEKNLSIAKSKVKEQIKKEKPTQQFYDSKKIKVSFEGALMVDLSEYYATTTTLLKVRNQFSQNASIIQNDIDAIMTKEQITKEDKKKLNELGNQLETSRNVYNFFNKKIQKQLLECSQLVSDEVYKAFTNRVNNKEDYRNALKKMIENATNRKLKDDSIIDLIEASIGLATRASFNKKCIGTFATQLNVKSYKFQLMELLLDVALRKGAISTKVVENCLNTTVEEIEEFTKVPQYKRPTTLKGYKDLFKELNIAIDTKAKKADCIKVFNKSVKSGLFVEC